MSSTRSRNKFCLSLDNSSSSASSNTTHLNRWSEVVPPKTALTFAALWDPEEGMVTFSGAALLESESSSGRSSQPDIFDDDYSQFMSLDRDIDGGVTTDENTATLATFQDVFKAFLRHTHWDSREHLNSKAGQSATRASSTFDGLDVYSHDVQVKGRRSLQLSCIDLLDTESSFRAPSAFGKLRLRSDLMLDSCRSESEGDSSRPSYLISRFSTTTTSTSNYVDITASAAQSLRISETSPIPGWNPPNECVSPASSWPYLPRRRRLLRKRRPFDGDVTTTTTCSTPSTPRKVTPKSSISPSPCSPSPSARVFSSTAALALGEERRGRFPRPIGGPITPPPTPPNTPTKSPRLKLRFAFLPKRKRRQTSSDSDGWVCIDFTPIIRERYIPDPDQD
ncbi:hypothetical protein OG21DRAFT_1496184 [Imleria badia]|nr:hypothetical protein OG21DRAFT_1496184 [Imleria badia]